MAKRITLGVAFNGECARMQIAFRKEDGIMAHAKPWNPAANALAILNRPVSEYGNSARNR